MQLFDIDEDNCITQEEFSGLLRSALEYVILTSTTSSKKLMPMDQDT